LVLLGIVTKTEDSEEEVVESLLGENERKVEVVVEEEEERWKTNPNWGLVLFEPGQGAVSCKPWELSKRQLHPSLSQPHPKLTVKLTHLEQDKVAYPSVKTNNVIIWWVNMGSFLLKEYKVSN